MRLILGKRLLSLVAAVVTALALLAVPARAYAGPGWDKPGPYQVSSRADSVTTFYYPSNIATDSAKHPVIIWGNGTFAFPVIYDGLLKHWASHGFIVAAANTAFSNTGLEMRTGIDTLTKWNGQDGSPFKGKVDLGNIGAAGHSQGGAGAINATLDPRVKTTIPIQPGPLALPSYLHGPTLYLAGQYDVIVFPALVQAFYNNSEHVPAIYAELAGATHFTTIGDGGGFRGITTAWFALQLQNDERARGLFYGPNCGICSGSTWLNVKRNAKITG